MYIASIIPIYFPGGGLPRPLSHNLASLIPSLPPSIFHTASNKNLRRGKAGYEATTWLCCAIPTVDGSIPNVGDYSPDPPLLTPKGGTKSWLDLNVSFFTLLQYISTIICSKLTMLEFLVLLSQL